MVFCHVRARNQNHWLADEAELADAAGTGTADNQVGCLVGCTHVADEVGNLEHRQFLAYHLLHDGSVVVLTCLPDKLHTAFLYQVEVLQHTLVDGSCT